MQPTWQVVLNTSSKVHLQPTVILTIPHTKIYKDVFDERRRITRFRISPHALMYKADPSPRTDAEQNSA